MPITDAVAIGNLPPELTSFVGRRREIGEVKGLLSESRLVTLTGIGGAGKTRLALRVAADLDWAFDDGVWFVDLTQLHDQGLLGLELENPDVLAYLVGATLGLRDVGGEPLDWLAEQLASRRMLLVLDNCVHLIPSSASLAHALLTVCPELRILATSRDPLGIGGETVFPVPPLPVPASRQWWSLTEMIRSEAVVLFLARAQAVATAFQLTADNHVAVGELCHRLDGLPLAIELAAARVRVLAPQQILARLTDRFALLSRGIRAAPERQQTLRACIDWSFDLCTKSEQMLWARLSVFVGGFELDAVEGVCSDERLPKADVLELVAGLVDKSILVHDDVRDGHRKRARYRMLETIHDYGQAKLIEAGEDGLLRRRHRDWYQQLVTRASAEWADDQQGYWLGREHSNLRAAFEFGLTERGEAEAALRLAVNIPEHHWSSSGRLGDSRRWLDRALAQVSPPTAACARAYLINSHLAAWQGDAATARRLLDEGEELARRLDASAELGHAAYIRGVGALLLNDLPRSVEALDRARRMLSGTPDANRYIYLNLLSAFGVAAGLADDLERASTCQQKMLALVNHRGRARYRSLAHWGGALIDWRRGDLPKADAQVGEALRLSSQWGSDDRYVAALCLELLSWIRAGRQHHLRAATRWAPPTRGGPTSVRQSLSTCSSSSTATTVSGRPAMPSAIPRSLTPWPTAAPSRTRPRSPMPSVSRRSEDRRRPRLDSVCGVLCEPAAPSCGSTRSTTWT